MGKELAGKWVVHIIGQGDMLDMPDELTALRNANGINLDLATLLEENGSTAHDPVVFVVVKNVPVTGV